MESESTLGRLGHLDMAETRAQPTSHPPPRERVRPDMGTIKNTIQRTGTVNLLGGAG